MTMLFDLPCWEIMQCEDAEDCPVRQQTDGTRCWEIVKEFEDYRSSYDICQDCLVYLLKKEARPFTEQEIMAMTMVRCPHRGNTAGHESQIAIL
jgi:hypothetical protein